MKKIVKLIACLFFPLLVGGISGFLTRENIADWYIFLNKPFFNPPNFLFGPVWTILYILMGYSFFLIINQPKINKRAVIIFFVQLILNFFWSIVFFAWHNLFWASIEIIFLWFSIIGMILIFYKQNKLAAFLNIPYLLWVSFATVLTLFIYKLN